MQVITIEVNQDAGGSWSCGIMASQGRSPFPGVFDSSIQASPWSRSQRVGDSRARRLLLALVSAGAHSAWPPLGVLQGWSLLGRSDPMGTVDILGEGVLYRFPFIVHYQSL